MQESLVFIIVVSLCTLALFKSLLNLFHPSSNPKQKKLPPGPKWVPVIGGFLWLRKSFSELEPHLRSLRTKYGPLITLQIGSSPAIFFGDHALAHRALVQNGALFSDRPRALPTGQVLNGNQHNITSAAYGPTWRLLRRNLTSRILHPSRINSFSRARKLVLEILISRLQNKEDIACEDEIEKGHTGDSSIVKVAGHFQHAMFCLLVLMCFGDDKLVDEKHIKEIERVQRAILMGSMGRFSVLNFWPSLGRIVFRKMWEELKKVRQNQEDVLIPLIRARVNAIAAAKRNEKEEEMVVAYVDTLCELELPVEKRKLEVEEMVSLCGEFLNAGTDTTSTALQWIMANLVKYPPIQAKLYEEIRGVVGPPPRTFSPIIREEDLANMKYLKAVVLEGLRRHPPGHFVLPHSVSEEVEFDGYIIPRKATLNFMVAEMGWDPKVWENPMDFNPERFLGTGEESLCLFDVTGNREIKMMPFGAGRRVCPASGLAMLHLEYFVANLIWYFHWGPIDDVDLSEKQEFTVVMKNPLQVHLSPRFNHHHH